ncbi:MAG TPA: hypothetical protein PLO67_10015 [Saprospiraceae bacterium]|nr:hypothetical protein [Saprospiraceae bacterium]HPI06218.1 hypothetical protein [Saprospiraceae bacterium]
MMARLFAPLQSRFNVRNHPVVRKVLLPLFVVSALFALLAGMDARISDDPSRIVFHFRAVAAMAFLAGLLLAWLFEARWWQGYSVARKNLLLAGSVLWGICLFCLISPRVGWQNTAPGYLGMYLPLLLTAGIPWFFWRTVCSLAAIPQLRYAPYRFDSIQDAIATVDWSQNLQVGIRWVFIDDFSEVSPDGIYTFRTFTPNTLKTIPLGHLFKALLGLHNIQTRAQTPILFQEYGWEFYNYPYWFWPRRKRYLDPYKIMRKLRVRYPVVSKLERQRASFPLHRRFRSATIYVTRSK